MIGGLKTIQVKVGHEREFEALFARLREEVRVHEPGNRLYSLLRSRTDPAVYIVQEQYADQAAFDAHKSSPHGALYYPQIRALLDHLAVEYYEGVVE